MKKLFGHLWTDDRGALISIEYLFVATVLVIGVVVGLGNLRDAVNCELTELGNALLALNQGFTVSGASGNSSSVSGSQAIDINGGPLSTTHTPPVPVVIDCTP